VSDEQKKYSFSISGAQYVGMGKDFYDNFSVAREVFDEADERLSMHFSRLIFEGPQSELTLTKNSQLAIYIVSWAICKTLQQEYPELQPAVCAGLSLGEYTALTAAKKLAFEQGLPLVAKRAMLMHEACVTHPGSMRVVLGMEEEAVEKTLVSLPSSAQVWIANVNCPGQIVIAGTLSGLDLAAELLKQKGAKMVLPLEVSGAFHSGLMQSAQDALSPYLLSVPFTDSSTELVMNTPGSYVQDTDRIRSYLIQQVTQPVRWQKGIHAMEEKKVDLYVEIGCGKTLQGMNKRIGVTASTINIEKVTELEEVLKGKECVNEIA
jgi:[acyl-carrier-protein] S-malonyltransferase